MYALGLSVENAKQQILLEQAFCRIASDLLIVHALGQNLKPAKLLIYLIVTAGQKLKALLYAFCIRRLAKSVLCAQKHRPKCGKQRGLCAVIPPQRIDHIANLLFAAGI